MSKTVSNTIEFIGGPFDGHIEVLPFNAEELPTYLVCFISRNTLLNLSGLSSNIEDGFTSVAIYECSLQNAMWAYWFVESVAPDQVEILSETDETEN